MRALFEHFARRNYFTLRRCPRPNLTFAWSRFEIRRRLFRRSLRHFPFDTHLPFELRPIEHERRVRIDLELPRLRTFVIREENKTVAINLLEQNHARATSAIASIR